MLVSTLCKYIRVRYNVARNPRRCSWGWNSSSRHRSSKLQPSDPTHELKEDESLCPCVRSPDGLGMKISLDGAALTFQLGQEIILCFEDLGCVLYFAQARNLMNATGSSAPFASHSAAGSFNTSVKCLRQASKRRKRDNLSQSCQGIDNSASLAFMGVRSCEVRSEVRTVQQSDSLVEMPAHRPGGLMSLKQVCAISCRRGLILNATEETKKRLSRLRQL